MQNPMERKAHGRSGRAGYGVGPEGRKAGGLVVTEAGVPHQLEGRFSGGAAKNISRNAAVKAEHGAQHPQGRVEYGVLHAEKKGLAFTSHLIRQCRPAFVTENMSYPVFFLSKIRFISSGKGASKASLAPVKGCFSSSLAEWRAGREMRAGSSVP